MRDLQRFVPEYVSSSAGGTMVELELENLLFDAPNANLLDVKLGTNTVTESARAKGLDYCKTRLA